MKKFYFKFAFPLVIIILFFAKSGKAQQQTISADNLKKLNLYQDSLKSIADSIINGEQDIVRQKCCYSFIKKLVATLKTPQSFLYTFDSLKTVSIVNSPDQKFRIFSWNLPRTNGTFRYYGAIQMNDEKELKLFPLFDYSPLIRNVEDTICRQDSWYGCMYYNIIIKKVGNKSYYNLFGWKGYNTREVKKVFDVLTFGSDKKPMFGQNAIIQTKENGKLKMVRRFVISYNRTAIVSMNYYDATDQVIFDHLVSKQAIEGKPLVPGKQRGIDMFPDGTYEAFVWKNNRWEYVEELQNVDYQTAPVPVPIFK